MQYTTLGATGIRVSRLCFGTLTLSPLQRNMTVAEGARVLEYAFEHGVNFLDTAELYGNYAHIALAMRRFPDVVVATKCYAYDAATAQASFEQAMRELGREYIDIFMLHEQESEYTLRGHAEALSFFAQKKQQGYIGALGVSTHFVACAKAALRHPEVEVIHPLINMRGLGICDGTAGDMEEAIAALHAQGKGIYAMKPLGGGHFIHEAYAAFNYILGLGGVHSVAVGMQSCAEVDYNCAVFEGLPVDEQTKSAIGRTKRELLIQDWCEGCGSCVRTCKSGALSLQDGRAVADPARCVFCGYCAACCPQFCIKVI